MAPRCLSAHSIGAPALSYSSSVISPLLGGAHRRTSSRRCYGTHVIVQILDTDAKTRHQITFLENVLIATAEGWHASLKAK